MVIDGRVAGDFPAYRDPDMLAKLFEGISMDEQNPKEGIFLVPGLQFSECPWCKQSGNSFWLVISENSAHDIEFDVVCDKCKNAARHYIDMRKSGLTRKMILQDFGFR